MLNATEISQRRNQPFKKYLRATMDLFAAMIKEELMPREKDVIELLAKIVCEYKRGTKYIAFSRNDSA